MPRSADEDVENEFVAGVIATADAVFPAVLMSIVPAVTPPEPFVASSPMIVSAEAPERPFDLKAYVPAICDRANEALCCCANMPSLAMFG